MQKITCKTFAFPQKEPLINLLDILEQSDFQAIHFTLDEYFNVGLPSLFALTPADKRPLRKSTTPPKTDMLTALGDFALNCDPLSTLNHYVDKPPELFSSVWMLPTGLFTCPMDIPSLFHPDNFNSSSYMKLGDRFHLGTWTDAGNHGFIDATKRLSTLADQATKIILHPNTPNARHWHLAIQPLGA